MGRRPELKVNELYYIKLKDDLTRNVNEYIAEILKIGPQVQPNRLYISLNILASSQDQGLALHELRRTTVCYRQADGTYQRPALIKYLGPFNEGGEYLWEKAVYIQMIGQSPVWMNDAVICHVKPSNLPLYISWPFGSDWVAQQLERM